MSLRATQLAVPLAALAILGCQLDGDGQPVADLPTQKVLLGDFELDVDPEKGTAVLTMLGSTSKGLVREIPFGADGDPNTNPPGTIQAITSNALGPGEGDCPALTNCFDLQLTNFTGTTQFTVFMGIDTITPPTGRDLLNPDPVPTGVSAALGGRAFGDLENLEASAVQELDFELPSGDPYTVRGRFWGDNGVLNEVDENGRPTGNAAPLNPGTVPVSGLDANGRGGPAFTAGSAQTQTIDEKGRPLPP